MNDIIACAAAAANSSLPTSVLGVLHFLHSRGRSSSCVHTPSELLRDFATREFNAFLWLCLVAVTTLLLRRLFNLFRLWHRAKTIPGPPSPSFFGHCKLFSRQNFTFTGAFFVIISFIYSILNDPSCVMLVVIFL